MHTSYCTLTYSAFRSKHLLYSVAVQVVVAEQVVPVDVLAAMALVLMLVELVRAVACY